MIIEQITAFFIILIFFLPLMAKTVRLASRTWDEREYLDKTRVRQIVFLVPAIVIFVFVLFYFGVVALLQILVF